MNRVILLSTAVLLLSLPAMAGPEKVLFPPYQTHVLLTVVDRPDVKEVREVYATPEAISMARAGRPVPSGTVLTLVHFKARVNDTGELVKDPNGRLVKGELDRIGVMEKRTGWGTEYPEDIRNGEWEYALFRADGARNETANIKACFECHKPKEAQDFIFRIEELKASR
jgi:hypothetical protein